eukprot:910076-Pleurochrysis_carterae.AAC.1
MCIRDRPRSVQHRGRRHGARVAAVWRRDEGGGGRVRERVEQAGREDQRVRELVQRDAEEVVKVALGARGLKMPRRPVEVGGGGPAVLVRLAVARKGDRVAALADVGTGNADRTRSDEHDHVGVRDPGRAKRGGHLGAAVEAAAVRTHGEWS